MTITNGSRAEAPHVPPAGVWVPAITFFDPKTDTLDLPSQKRYYTYLSTTGLSGLVILGTNAEAFLLTRSERSTLIALARSAVGPTYPLIAGCGAHSTAQVLECISDAHAAGADYALVLPPAYFGKATTPSVIESFFLDIAKQSPLPIVIYNFPGVCNGVDMDSELITRIVKRAAGNVVGVKLTCASVGKITRLAATFAPDEFAIFGGQSDFLIGGLAAGSAGCIAAFGNVIPKSIVRVYELWMAGRVEDARALHRKAALAENSVKAGIAAVKFASAAVGAAKAAGIEGAEEKLGPRKPYEPLGEKAKEGIRRWRRLREYIMILEVVCLGRSNEQFPFQAEAEAPNTTALTNSAKREFNCRVIPGTEEERASEIESGLGVLVERAKGSPAAAEGPDTLNIFGS